MNNNKRKRLNLEEKLNIIKTKETENLSVRVLAERFCISKSQVNNILQDACNLKKYYAENGNEDMRRKFSKTSDGALVDKVTFEWFCRARSYNLPVSGPLLQEKAREVANESALLVTTLYFYFLWLGSIFCDDHVDTDN